MVEPFVPEGEIFEGIFRQNEGIPEFATYVNGEWVFTGKTAEVRSPIDGSLIARVSLSDMALSNRAVAAAYSAGRHEIRDTPGEKRLEAFLKVAELIRDSFDDFVTALVLDAGKPLSNARGEVTATIERLEKTTMEFGRLIGDYIPGDWSAESLGSEGIVKREPYGVVLAISPYNYPLFISTAKIVPALLAGNAVLLKPSSQDPLAPLLLSRVLQLAGIPESAYHLLTVPGALMDSILADRRIRAVTFTGSTEVGEHILSMGGIKFYHMELGGKDPAVVLDDAPLEETVEKLVKGMVSYSGQRCDAIRLIIAEEGIYEQLKRELVAALSKIEPENPLEDEDAIMGPLINERSAEKIEEVYRDALEKGAVPLTGFKRKGAYVWPVLLEASREVLPGLRAFQEDVFGPLTILVKVSNEDEAVELANSSRFGLDAAVFSGDDSRARKVARRLEVGAVFINEFPRHGIGYYPFGGMKDSGIGREGIGYSIETLTTTKTIVRNYRGRGVWDYI
ncbi:NADP-dependent glyceraldehyde-3-phosphate dehydrogenase (non-phosphorylating) [Thermococcus kodakarensis KOD1]|uniref:NADP-dependent glyceraldehyde-3-phosphate dehydrogenase (Non-phosphorylating) n=1 Tax=Thermococcus kodakarensis (strain ATCC BAA-918 / JCM 12380 / KOD1) TaxID=69014 RepID=Q5JG59_THEKO|nr:NADP-dependent glyceraldehyde-3-phosphate dehydrogenase [Thermococcus kodakarensis]WCN29210.1 NADP-dependent glyceraldehyde-3-phosphate dehydrogenase [Thermococcus kodakarensis]WCN31514.1 NADP-dependent glyceraldehyde-3-phosphate dehydrogenase [Thermococcus kodakarensis]BAD84894.1 NADP-dependent glyceraldehyde-3-phosphate dehydrogenase (non-phosphorylating) [Thermococcus kodakarensis KOD1]